MSDEHIRDLIADWAVFHGFQDDCGYPLISPSDVVLDDLAFRLSLSGDRNAVDKAARARWETIPACKGKEKRLRRAAEWQPIETASTDHEGPPILTWDGNKVHLTTRGFTAHTRQPGWFDEKGWLIHPTHWMPLPEPPK